MEKTLGVLQEMKEESLFSAYAIGGGIASSFYAEVVNTYDLDVFIILESESVVVSLTPIYSWLKERGYTSYDKEAIIIGGVPVQFIIAYNPLVEEAVKNAEIKSVFGVNVPVIKVEYVIAIMVQTGRPKDKARLPMLIDSIFVDGTDESFKSVEDLLIRYNLLDKFKEMYDI